MTTNKQALRADAVRSAQARLTSGGYMARLPQKDVALIRMLGLVLETLPTGVVADLFRYAKAEAAAKGGAL